MKQKMFCAQASDVQMECLSRGGHSWELHAVIGLDGEIDRGRLTQAAERLALVFPFLGCIYSADRYCFVERESFQPGDMLVFRPDLTQPEQMIGQGLPPDRLLLRIALIQGAMVVSASHVLTDAAGLKEMLYIMCRFYNNPRDDDSPYRWLMRRDAAGLIMKKLDEKDRDRIWTVIPRYDEIRNRSDNCLFLQEAGENECCVLTGCVSADEMETIHRKAKTAGATLNDVFLTALCRSLYRIFSWKRIYVPCTTDLRKHTDHKMGICNCSGRFQFYFETKENESFSRSLERTALYMGKEKADKADLLLPALIRLSYMMTGPAVFAERSAAAKVPEPLTWSNYGRVDQKNVWFQDAGITECFITGTTMEAPECLLGVSTWNGKAVLNVSGYFAYQDRKVLQKLLDMMIEELTDYAHSH